MPDISGDTLAVGLVWYVVFLFSTVLHEASHALAARLGGDETAAMGGQVGLDPLPHMRREPYGMLVIPWLTFFLNGWMMGWASTPFDPFWADRNPKRAGAMSLAGPAANFSLMLIAGTAMKIGLMQGWLEPGGHHGLAGLVSMHGDSNALTMALSITFSLNLILGCFNLVPLPPLDGSGAITLLMTDDAARSWNGFIRQPMMAMAGIMIAWLVFPRLFAPVFPLAFRLLFG